MLFFVYILASGHYGTLYVGSTNNLARRIWEHKSRAVPGFTKKYAVDRLVWFETHETLEAALIRERQIKRWRRDWKSGMLTFRTTVECVTKSQSSKSNSKRIPKPNFSNTSKAEGRLGPG